MGRRAARPPRALQVLKPAGTVNSNALTVQLHVGNWAGWPYRPANTFSFATVPLSPVDCGHVRTRGPIPTRMKTVSVVAQKGGTGKTTLCLAIACAAVHDGLAAAVVDLDPQATAASWGDRRERDLPVVLTAQPPRLARVLEAAASQGIDLAVVDTAPRVEQSAVAAARAADLVVVPCRPAVYDLETVAATVDVIRAVAPDTRFLCVLNGVPPRGPRQPQARRLLDDMGVPVCAASLGLRAAVDYAAAAGASAQEHEPRGKAAAEIAAVYEAIRQALSLSGATHADFSGRPQGHLPTGGQDRLSSSGQGNSSTSRKGALPTSRKNRSSTHRQGGLAGSRQGHASTGGQFDCATDPKRDLSASRQDQCSTSRRDDPPTSPQAHLAACREGDASARPQRRRFRPRCRELRCRQSALTCAGRFSTKPAGIPAAAAVEPLRPRPLTPFRSGGPPNPGASARSA